ncbi:hypothetical protein BKA93DRAFT_815979 [Sparassis latifolia]
MWGIFDETGISASACHHGMILWLADMVCSGELAKYPITIIAKALEVLGPWQLCGYDIGCRFSNIIDESSLGETFQCMNCQCCINAFHGYSHSHFCQTQHHPNIIEGMGIEDLETLKCIFSASNQLAAQWDNDKYLNLGNFLYNNYIQALKIITKDSFMLAEAMTSLGITKEDLKEWQDEEVHVHTVTYFELLQELQTLEYINLILLHSEINDASRMHKLETERRHIAEHRTLVLQDVIGMEVSMSISTRWQPTLPEYISMMKYLWGVSPFVFT